MEQFEEEIEGKRSPLKIILVVFLILLIVLMTVSYYAVKVDPKPNFRVSLDDVLINAPSYDGENRINSIQDARSLVISDFMKHVVGKVGSSCKEVKDVCYAKAFYYFVRDEIEYLPDPDQQIIEVPERTLLSGSSDCENEAILLSIMLKSIGLDSRIVLVERHAYVQVYLPDAAKIYKMNEDWVGLDPTCKYCEFGEVPPNDLEILDYVYMQ